MSYGKTNYRSYIKRSVSQQKVTQRIDAGARRSPALRNTQTEIKLRGKKLKQRAPKPTFKVR